MASSMRPTCSSSRSGSNVTHGSFYAFGALGAASAVGIYFEKGWPVAGGFLMMVLVAMGIGLVLGLIIERGLLRLVCAGD